MMDMMGDADDAVAEVADFAPKAQSLIEKVKKTPESVEFDETMAAIEAGFEISSVAFTCGKVVSAAGENQGSAKIFSFAKLADLSEPETLQLFGKFYRDDVLNNPDGDDHGNIRNFIEGGWKAVTFNDGLALKAK